MTQLLVPLPPTSEQPGYSVAYRTHIHILDNDSLLQIFGHYRLEHKDNWNLRLTWRKLAQVCRRWRYLIYDSPSHLDICLLLTNDSPSIDTLSHLPPLPLVIDYSDGTRAMARKDEDNIHLGLQQHDHVNRVTLRAPSLSLRLWLEPMNKLFPRLRDLSLSSTTIEEVNVVLPETLRAPDLRHLVLHGVGLPAGFPLLASTISLSTLSMTHIGASCYFPPGHLVTQLQFLPNLEELSIGFDIPIPLPSSEGELLPPPVPPVTLPNLRRLTFRGVDIYIDNLVAQIITTLLERLSLTLFFDLAFTLVNLAEFILGTEGFGCPVSWVIFNKDGASIDTGHGQRGTERLSLHVYCESLDWQIDSATLVCGALEKVLSNVEELILDLDVDGIPSDWESSPDGMLWYELLLPFIGVKKLYIGSSLTLELSQTLELVAGGLVLEILPELNELEVQLEFDDAKNAFSTFLETRESVGHPVLLLASLIPHAEPEVLRADPEVLPTDPEVLYADPEVPRATSEEHPIDSTTVLDYMDYIGRPYQNQAIVLIDLCRCFIGEQELTSRSYDALRR